MGKPLPKGPLKAIRSPFCNSNRALVTEPAFLIQISMIPGLVGGDEIDMGASPTPNTVTSTN